VPNPPPMPDPLASSEAMAGFLVSAVDAGEGRAGGPDCPDENRLAALADGRADPAREALVEHLADCAGCRSVLAALVRERAGDPRGLAARATDLTEPAVPPQPAAAPTPGFPRPFGPYLLRREIGHGGMGRVYEAVHERRGRPEALKVLRGRFLEDEALARRFGREVRALARVSHDHVVTLFDSGQVGGALYYTMALLPGPSLGELLERIRDSGEAPPGPRALALLDEIGVPRAPTPSPSPGVEYARRIAGALVGVADALAFLHAARIVHRDVKPSNLLFDGRHRLQLADFGLARTPDQRITEAGRVVGTPAYMSPEQILEQGEAFDGRADVYSLGVVLFELLALALPHEGETLAEMMGFVLRRRARSVRALNPALPAEIETIVSRCLERRPEDRYSDAGALRDDLARFAAGEPVRARPLSPATRLLRALRRQAVPIAIVLASIAAMAGWAFLRPAYLTVHSTPAAQVYLDDREVGRSPLHEHAVGTGLHVLRLEREGYVPLVERFDASRGETETFRVFLQALDPAAPGPRTEFAHALGLARSGADLEVVRGGGAEGGPLLAPLWPRGALRAVPTAVTLVARDLADGYTATLRAPGRGDLHAWPVRDAYGLVELALPDDVVRAFAPEETYEVVVTKAGAEAASASFRILGPRAIAELDRWLAETRSRFSPADASFEFVKAEALLARDLYEEALAAVAALEVLHGVRRELAPLAPAVLDRAGVGPSDPRTRWSARYLLWPD
jgi:serine/threonine protein kinase